MGMNRLQFMVGCHLCMVRRTENVQLQQPGLQHGYWPLHSGACVRALTDMCCNLAFVVLCLARSHFVRRFADFHHYPQVVWVGSTRLGCASATGSGCPYGVYYVCNYAPVRWQMLGSNVQHKTLAGLPTVCVYAGVCCFHPAAWQC
jgi:hypothetical protein